MARRSAISCAVTPCRAGLPEPSVSLVVNGLCSRKSLHLLVFQGCQPRKELDRIARKNGIAFCAVEFRTRFNFTGAPHGNVAPKVREVGTEEHLLDAHDGPQHLQYR